MIPRAPHKWALTRKGLRRWRRSKAYRRATATEQAWAEHTRRTAFSVRQIAKVGAACQAAAEKALTDLARSLKMAFACGGIIDTFWTSASKIATKTFLPLPKSQSPAVRGQLIIDDKEWRP